jgi:transposase InsO family protein
MRAAFTDPWEQQERPKWPLVTQFLPRALPAPNEIWQADHTQLDILILDERRRPMRTWLTVIEDDHSRPIAGYVVFLGAPSALQTALALRQAIWRKGRCAGSRTSCTAITPRTSPAATSTRSAPICTSAWCTRRRVPQGRGKLERPCEPVRLHIAGGQPAA